MNPWVVAALAAAGIFLWRSSIGQQTQAEHAQAGTLAGAGQTSDQGGGAFDPATGTIIPYQGGVTQPVSTVSYQPPSDTGSFSGSSYYFAPPPDRSGTSSFPNAPGAGGGYTDPAYNQLPGSPVSSLISNPYNAQYTSASAALQPTRSGAQL